MLKNINPTIKKFLFYAGLILLAGIVLYFVMTISYDVNHPGRAL